MLGYSRRNSGPISSKKAAVYKITAWECTGPAGEGHSRAEALTQGLPPLVTLYSFQISHLKETKEKKWKNKTKLPSQGSMALISNVFCLP